MYRCDTALTLVTSKSSRDYADIRLKSMPPKGPQGRRRTAPRKKQDTIEIVVRRGAMRRFDALKTRTSDLPVVVTWDRRTDDRRDDDAAGANATVGTPTGVVNRLSRGTSPTSWSSSQ
jgi:hypothetical protein